MAATNTAAIASLDARRAIARAQFDWLDAVVADHELSPAAFKVAYIVRKFINKQSGEAWPTQQTLSAETGWVVRHVRRLIGELVERGHLTILRGCGRNTVNRYRLAVRGEKSVPLNGPLSGRECPLELGDDGTSLSKIADESVQEGGRKCLPEPRNQPTSQPRESKGHADGAPKADGFDEFYAAYPKKVARLAAWSAYERALKRGAVHQDILAAVRRYRDERRGQDPKYTKHPATWLNQGCWDDEHPGPHIKVGTNQSAIRPSGMDSVLAGVESFAREEET